MLLALSSLVFAEQCYFQTRRSSYDSGPKVKKISCEMMKKITQDIQFYKDSKDNYAQKYGRYIGEEGNLILEESGVTLIMKFYYALGEYRYYGHIVYNGGNVAECVTTTSTGVCDHVEFTDFGYHFTEFLSSSARKKNRK